jgi:hypothetical protein
MDLFNNLTLNAVQIIQIMLAPALMISACGLLLLSINNKYSTVVNRIRLMNEEKRKLMAVIGERELTTDDNVRFESIAIQIEDLVLRAKLVRNSVLAFEIAIGLFVVTSLLIGVSSFLSLGKLNFPIIIVFLLGKIFVLVGTVYAAMETRKGYNIILYEVNAHE